MNIQRTSHTSHLIENIEYNIAPLNRVLPSNYVIVPDDIDMTTFKIPDKICGSSVAFEFSLLKDPEHKVYRGKVATFYPSPDDSESRYNEKKQKSVSNTAEEVMAHKLANMYNDAVPDTRLIEDKNGIICNLISQNVGITDGVGFNDQTFFCIEKIDCIEFRDFLSHSRSLHYVSQDKVDIYTQNQSVYNNLISERNRLKGGVNHPYYLSDEDKVKFKRNDAELLAIRNKMFRMLSLDFRAETCREIAFAINGLKEHDPLNYEGENLAYRIMADGTLKAVIIDRDLSLDQGPFKGDKYSDNTEYEFELYKTQNEMAGFLSDLPENARELHKSTGAPYSHYFEFYNDAEMLPYRKEATLAALNILSQNEIRLTAQALQPFIERDPSRSVDKLCETLTTHILSKLAGNISEEYPGN